MLPSARPSPQSKRKSIGSAVFAQLAAESPYTLQWVLLCPKITHSRLESGIQSNTWFPGPIRAQNPNGVTIGSAAFAQMTAVSLYFTMWRPLHPPQNCPFPCGIWTPSNTWLLAPTRVLNGISSASAIFAGVTSVTDRPTGRSIDRPTDDVTRSVRTGRIYVSTIACSLIIIKGTSTFRYTRSM